MVSYEFARNKKVTIAALVLDVLSLFSFALLADAVLGGEFGMQTVVTHHVSWKIALVIVLVFQYALAGVEFIARLREEHRGFTLPLVLLPFGHVVRFALLAVLESIVVVPKLLAYFVSVLLEFVFQIFRVSRFVGTAHFVDFIDSVAEPVERFVNAVYNKLFYVKIQENGNVFNAVFNNCLTLWCINH